MTRKATTLTAAEHRLIHRLSQDFSTAHLARQFDVSPQAISQIKRGTWLNSAGHSQVSGVTPSPWAGKLSR